MSRVAHACVDAGVALLLVMALVVVYWVDRRGPGPGRTSVVVEPPVQDKKPTPVPISLAVTPTGFDDMGKLLESLGAGYKFTVVDEKTLADPTACARFDAIFLTCAKPGDRSLEARLSASLKGFVSNGGTLYASDLRFDILKAAFPELVDAETEAQGLKQNMRADVIPPELRELLGGEIALHFDLDGWRPAAFRGESVTVYLKGSCRTTAGLNIEAPLLVKFPYGRGTVLFTSFHNEKQSSVLESKLLNHLVLSTVTARVAETVTQEMVRGGFSLQKTSLLTAAPGDPSLARSYAHEKSGGLVFTLGFEARGAKLRLEVVSPDGRKLVKSGNSTLAIDVPDAVAGTWSYTATPESLPYANFPFTMSVGAAGAPKAPSVAPVATVRRAEGLVAATVRFRKVLFAQAADIAEPKNKRIAITPPLFDDMGKLLATLGEGYRFRTISHDDLLSPKCLDEFDVVFLTCSTLPGPWFVSSDGDDERPGVTYGTPRVDVFQKFGEVVRRFVERGGTLYASDMHKPLVFWAFPERRASLVLDLAPIAELAAVETEWLKTKVPSAKVGSVAETLRNVGLSPALTDQIDLLIASIEISSLVGGQIAQPLDKPENVVRDSCGWTNLPATEADIKAIATALVEWNRAIAAAFRARPRAGLMRARNQILRLENRIKSLRDQINKDDRGVENQRITAQVLDPGLKEILGAEISLNFNTRAWETATFSGKDVVECLRGTYQPIEGARAEAPLLVKFKEGKGAVIFTSFHNEAQNSRQEEALLKYLVFSAVTAKEQEVADKTMLAGGFSPVKRSLESHTSGQASATKSYRSPTGGPIRFSLSFSGQGARLKLRLRAPNGDVFEEETRGTLVVEATGAPAGEWQYTVIGLQVPFDNFAFSVSIGEVSTSSSSTAPSP